MPLNPYSSPTFCDEAKLSAGQQTLSSAITMTGLLLATCVSVGVINKLLDDAACFGTTFLQQFVQQTSGVVGVFAFALAAWTLLGLMSSVGTQFHAECEPFSKALVLIAIVSMFARMLYEPIYQWTPLWPSYGLTFAAAVAMGWVFRRVRLGSSASEIYSPVVNKWPRDVSVA